MSALGFYLNLKALLGKRREGLGTNANTSMLTTDLSSKGGQFR